MFSPSYWNIKHSELQWYTWRLSFPNSTEMWNRIAVRQYLQHHLYRIYRFTFLKHIFTKVLCVPSERDLKQNMQLVHSLVSPEWVSKSWAIQISCPCQRVAGVCPAQQRSPAGRAPAATSATAREKSWDARKVWTQSFKDLLLSDRQVLLCPSTPRCVLTFLFVSLKTRLRPCALLSVFAHHFLSLHTPSYPCTLLCVPGNHPVSLHISLCPWKSLCPCTPLCAPQIGCHIDMQEHSPLNKNQAVKGIVYFCHPFPQFPFLTLGRGNTLNEISCEIQLCKLNFTGAKMLLLGFSLIWQHLSKTEQFFFEDLTENAQDSWWSIQHEVHYIAEFIPISIQKKCIPYSSIRTFEKNFFPHWLSNKPDGNGTLLILLGNECF